MVSDESRLAVLGRGKWDIYMTFQISAGAIGMVLCAGKLAEPQPCGLRMAGRILE